MAEKAGQTQESTPDVSGDMTPTEPRRSLNLEQRILGITKEMGRLEKDGENRKQSYNYTSEAAVKARLAELLPRWGVTIKHTTLKVKEGPAGNNGWFTTKVKILFTAKNADNPTEKDESIVWGSGRDNGEKGLAKAMTSAFKYYNFLTFSIATGDDPEASATDVDEEAGRATGGQAKPVQQPMQRGQERAPGQQGPQAPQGIISESKRRRLEKVAKDGGCDHGSLKAFAMVVYGYSSTAQIKDEHYKPIGEAFANGAVRAKTITQALFDGQTSPEDALAWIEDKYAPGGLHNVVAEDQFDCLACITEGQAQNYRMKKTAEANQAHNERQSEAAQS